MKLLRFIGPAEYNLLLKGETIKPIRVYNDTNTSFRGQSIMFFFEFKDETYAQFCYEAFGFGVIHERPWYAVVVQVPDDEVAKGVGTYSDPYNEGMSVEIPEFALEAYNINDVVVSYKVYYNRMMKHLEMTKISTAKYKTESVEIRESELNSLTEEDFIKAAEVCQKRYGFLNPNAVEENADVILISPRGVILDANTELGEIYTHTDLLGVISEFIPNKKKVFVNELDAYEYAVDNLGFITLNTGNGPMERTCKAVIAKRPTSRQLAVLKKWLERRAEDSEKIRVFTGDASSYQQKDYFPEHDNFSAKDIIKSIKRYFLSGVLERTLITESSKPKTKSLTVVYDKKTGKMEFMALIHERGSSSSNSWFSSWGNYYDISTHPYLYDREYKDMFLPQFHQELKELMMEEGIPVPKHTIDLRILMGDSDTIFIGGKDNEYIEIYNNKDFAKLISDLKTNVYPYLVKRPTSISANIVFDSELNDAGRPDFLYDPFETESSYDVYGERLAVNQSYKDDYTDTREIIKKITKYYTTGKLEESMTSDTIKLFRFMGEREYNLLRQGKPVIAYNKGKGNTTLKGKTLFFLEYTDKDYIVNDAVRFMYGIADTDYAVVIEVPRNLVKIGTGVYSDIYVSKEDFEDINDYWEATMKITEYGLSMYTVDDVINIYKLRSTRDGYELTDVSSTVSESTIKESAEVEIQTAGYITPDGSLIYLDEYHGEDPELQKMGYAEFSSTHLEEDTCVRLYQQPSREQYAMLERIIDTYLDTIGYCKAEIYDSVTNNYVFYEVYSLYEGAISHTSYKEKVGNWTGYKIVQILKRYYMKNEATTMINEMNLKSIDPARLYWKVYKYEDIEVGMYVSSFMSKRPRHIAKIDYVGDDPDDSYIRLTEEMDGEYYTYSTGGPEDELDVLCYEGKPFIEVHEDWPVKNESTLREAKAPKLSSDEKETLELLLNHGYSYLVRNKKNVLQAYASRPYKNASKDWVAFKDLPYTLQQQHMYSFVKYKDRQPKDITTLLNQIQTVEQPVEPIKEESEKPSYLSKEMLNDMVKDGYIGDNIEESIESGYIFNLEEELNSYKNTDGREDYDWSYVKTRVKRLLSKYVKLGKALEVSSGVYEIIYSDDTSALYDFIDVVLQDAMYKEINKRVDKMPRNKRESEASEFKETLDLHQLLDELKQEYPEVKSGWESVYSIMKDFVNHMIQEKYGHQDFSRKGLYVVTNYYVYQDFFDYYNEIKAQLTDRRNEILGEVTQATSMGNIVTYMPRQHSAKKRTRKNPIKK